jgi:hypothetical protein
MRSTAANVALYIAEQPQEWQPALTVLRSACLRIPVPVRT